MIAGILAAIGTFLTSEFVATIAIGALVGAGIGGLTAAVTGGDIGKGMLYGAIGGAVMGGITGVFNGSFSAATQATGAAYSGAGQATIAAAPMATAEGATAAFGAGEAITTTTTATAPPQSFMAKLSASLTAPETIGKVGAGVVQGLGEGMMAAGAQEAATETAEAAREDQFKMEDLRHRNRLAEIRETGTERRKDIEPMGAQRMAEIREPFEQRKEREAGKTATLGMLSQGA